MVRYSMVRYGKVCPACNVYFSSVLQNFYFWELSFPIIFIFTQNPATGCRLPEKSETFTWTNPKSKALKSLLKSFVCWFDSTTLNLRGLQMLLFCLYVTEMKEVTFIYNTNNGGLFTWSNHENWAFYFGSKIIINLFRVTRRN